MEGDRRERGGREEEEMRKRGGRKDKREETQKVRKQAKKFKKDYKSRKIAANQIVGDMSLKKR